LALCQDKVCGRLRADLDTRIAGDVVTPRWPAFHARYPGIQVDIKVCP
jgi:DNA-binding transcriptional LysR family regulator